MKQEITANNKTQSDNINRAAYILYMVLVVFQLITEDYEWAITNMGIALIFDPFGSAKWQDRTKPQRAWLLIHLSMLIAGAAFLFFR